MSKILANRLSFVIADIISEVQWAFVPNRQILDGHFILMSLSFGVQKSFQGRFVRWDFLEDVLKSFGFGDKWCGWINGCLNSAMGSILVIRSPTMEFQFHKGLFKGISYNDSLTLSHLFYADDTVFVGE
ncbi:hypothetical protein Tco_1198032 [Tanacetum coccineum]